MALRPRQLSVTDIEKWLRDPYAIYARHVLRLKPLDPLDPEPGPRERGIAIHNALEAFLARSSRCAARRCARALAACERRGVCRGRRIARCARAVAAALRARGALVPAYQATRREEIVRSITETSGTLELPGPAGPFTLIGRADRIDLFGDGLRRHHRLQDRPRAERKQIDALFAPQLPLEGAMLMGGGFADASASRACASSCYIKLTGGDPPGEAFVPQVRRHGEGLEARERLIGLIAHTTTNVAAIARARCRSA